SGVRMTSAPRETRSRYDASMRSRLRGTSPTVGLIWAKPIFTNAAPAGVASADSWRGSRVLVKAVFPAFVRFIERLLHDMAEGVEETGRGKTRHGGHDQLLREGALHGG